MCAPPNLHMDIYGSFIYDYKMKATKMSFPWCLDPYYSRKPPSVIICFFKYNIFIIKNNLLSSADKKHVAL